VIPPGMLGSGGRFGPLPLQRGPMQPMGGPRFGSLQPLGSFKKGGKVKKTGLYKLHKGERVMRAGMGKLSDLRHAR
jgi:hypothetical protein